jgi:hypothetical protein
MRNRWNEDGEYIVRLTKQLIGKTALETIIRENSKNCNPSVIRSYVVAIIMNKIEKMNDATLGRICAYASLRGVHDFKHSKSTARPKFINNTGFQNVLNGYNKSHPFDHLENGEYLELIAAYVITCVVTDIICQDKWQAEWDSWVMSEDEEKAL